MSQRMSAPFQAGEFPAPVKYGYASVGTIEQGPHDLRGRTAFALYPHQTRYVVPADAIHLVPDDVQSIAPSVLGHRVFFTPVYELRRAQIADALVAQILERVPTPR